MEKKIKRGFALFLAMVLMVTGVCDHPVSAAKKKAVLSNQKITLTVGKSKILSLKNNQKKVKWSIVSGKKYIQLKNKKKSSVKIVAIKKGNATVQAAVGKKKYRCSVVIQSKSNSDSNAPAKDHTTEQDQKTVSRSAWVADVMKVAGYEVQKELFNLDSNQKVKYSFDDIASDANADIIETAVQYGIIPDAGGNFLPDAAVDREFLAVTAVCSIGFSTEERSANYQDSSELEYDTEDAVAVELELVKISDRKFCPHQAVTKQEGDHALKILSDIVANRKIAANHKDTVSYQDGVIEEKKITNYTVSEQNSVYTVRVPAGTSLDKAVRGEKIVLPATSQYSQGMALVVETNDISEDYSERIITGTIPKKITDFVQTADLEGKNKIDAKNVKAVDGVSVVQKADRKSYAKELKKVSVDGSMDTEDMTKVSYKIDELDTTVSFYISELKYKINFDQNGVKELYIGLPNVLQVDTERKGSKEYSKKIGEIPVELPAGFSANIEVYLEAGINGKLTISLKLANDVGVQYYNNRFYVTKSCDPSLNVVVDADADLGVSVQVKLYWMNEIVELLQSDDSKPVYNIKTKWGIHGDATVQLRNDSITQYKDLECVSLGCYLYANVSAGKGSLLGDLFSLKKDWSIYTEKNTPFKRNIHIENGVVVEKCTYDALDEEDDTQTAGSAKGFVYFGNYIQDLVVNKKERKELSEQEFTDGKLYYKGTMYAKTRDGYFKSVPIKWRILKVDGDGYILQSEKILANRAYHEWMCACYGDSDIRKWLNTEFINEAFSKEEQADILTTSLMVKDLHWDPAHQNGTGSMVTTEYRNLQDKIYLLSHEQLTSEYGYGNAASRLARATRYVDWKERKSDWWLLGKYYYEYGITHNAYVGDNGEIYIWYQTWGKGIRPVLKIKKGSQYLSRSIK